MAATTNNPIFPQVVKTGLNTIVAADTTTSKVLYSAGANGSILDSIIISMQGTASPLIHFYIEASFGSGTTTYLLASYIIPPNSDGTVVPPLNLLTTLNAVVSTLGPVIITFNRDSNGNPYMYLGAGCSLSFAADITISSGTLTGIVQGGDF